jgi:hemoglobin
VTTPREYRDIETRDDCEQLVRAFYARAMQDPIIGFIFTDVAKLDLEAHVPVLTDFWETLLLGAQTYDRGSFHPHAALHAKVELRPGHFDRWLALWYQTVDELFAGPRAQAAQAHAYRLAQAFQRRLAGHPGPVEDRSAPINVTVVRDAQSRAS